MCFLAHFYLISFDISKKEEVEKDYHLQDEHDDCQNESTPDDRPAIEANTHRKEKEEFKNGNLSSTARKVVRE